MDGFHEAQVISNNQVRLKMNDISNIMHFDNPFGNSYSDIVNRFTYGTKNAVCELYILSKCSNFVGTPGSSFSFMVWLWYFK